MSAAGPDLSARVAEAWRNARDNGFFAGEWTRPQIALDMLTHDAEIEALDPSIDALVGVLAALGIGEADEATP